MSLVKICGITEEQEVEYVNEAGVDFMGMVMFFPKSKRNITVEKASSLIKKLNPAVTSVAVTVEPTLDQIREIEAAGIQMIQIHGDVSEELLQEIRIPVIKAFNVHDLSSYERYHQADIVKGYIFDAQTPGSGKTFDWSVLSDIPHDEKFALLAGGLNPDNGRGICRNSCGWCRHQLRCGERHRNRQRPGEDPEICGECEESVRDVLFQALCGQ